MYNIIKIRITHKIKELLIVNYYIIFKSSHICKYQLKIK